MSCQIKHLITIFSFLSDDINTYDKINKIRKVFFFIPKCGNEFDKHNVVLFILGFCGVFIVFSFVFCIP